MSGHRMRALDRPPDDGAPAVWLSVAQRDPPERVMGRRWLAVAAAALVTGVYTAQIVPAADTSPAPIAGIAPSYGPKTVSAVPNAAAIVRRVWLPGLDAGYDPQGLTLDGGGIYVSAYRQRQLWRPSRAVPGDAHRSRDGRPDRLCRRAEPVRPCRQPRGRRRRHALRRRHAHALRYPARPGVRAGCAIPAVSARSRGYWRARRVDAGWDLARYLRKWSRPTLPLHGGDPGP